MIFLKKYRNCIIAGALFIVFVILAWPIFSLFTTPKISFDFQLFTLMVVLISLLVLAFLKFIKNNIKDGEWIAIAGLFFAILFFLSDAAKKDLSTIENLTSATSYNCLVARGIINDQNSTRTISYGYYNTDIFIQNLGFLNERFGSNVEASGGQLIYDMTYSNRLLDSISRLDSPTNPPAKTAVYVGSFKNQVTSLAQEIDHIAGCSNVNTQEN